MNSAIYNTKTGEILRRTSTPINMVDIQCQDGEEFFLNCPGTATHIIDNEPVKVPPTSDQLLTTIRKQRNQKLATCDWTQVIDSPLTAEKIQTWAQYRQALRNFPETCDPQNPVWPVPPFSD